MRSFIILAWIFEGKGKIGVDSNIVVLQARSQSSSARLSMSQKPMKKYTGVRGELAPEMPKIAPEKSEKSPYKFA